MLSENNLCTYYDLDNNPGIKATGKFTAGRFDYLDDESLLKQLANFISDDKINITLSLPQMHCASCIYLLENLHRIEPGVISCRVNFDRKEALVSFDRKTTSLKKIVQVMAFIGYEPAISLHDAEKKGKKTFDKKRIIQLGVAGFCFSNIMMLSFPEYFSGGAIELKGLQHTFTGIIFLLSLPVIFYAAAPIMISAWKSLRQGVVNIDAPIAFASIITFGRSYMEIISGTGIGYLDSGTGIIFFMLIGRWFQSRTYDAISFDRQYKSYFPLGISVLRGHKEENIPVTKLKLSDIIIVRNEEMIPADAILLEGDAAIDYSFVSGESEPVKKKSGDVVFAGGRQLGTALKLKVIKEPSQSYITQLWNNDVFTAAKHREASFIHPWARYFTIVLFSIALFTGCYWAMYNPANLWPAVTAVLIVACPCSLLLSASFTFGHMQRSYGKNKLYLKNAGVIESMAAVKHIVFDKTGTLTETGTSRVQYYGVPLTELERVQVRKAAAQSSHPLSKALVKVLPGVGFAAVSQFVETPGKGATTRLEDATVELGSAGYVGLEPASRDADKSTVHVKIDGAYKGYFEINNQYRKGMDAMSASLKESGYSLHVLSGDNASEKSNLQHIFGKDVPVCFNVNPQEKLEYIRQLRSGGEKVLMAGDGLNDAGALMEADCGIAISDDTARFSPACDAILDGNYIHKLSQFLSFARWNRRIILAGFILSICYNVAGISFAVQAKLSPLTAAILMPSSSISIILLSWLLTRYIAGRHALSSKHDETQFLN